MCKHRYHRTTRGNLDNHVISLSVHPLEYIQQTLHTSPLKPGGPTKPTVNYQLMFLH